MVDVVVVRCRLIQSASRCVNELLASSCSAEEIADNPHLQSVGFLSPAAIDYVCVRHYDGNDTLVVNVT